MAYQENKSKALVNIIKVKNKFIGFFISLLTTNKSFE